LFQSTWLIISPNDTLTFILFITSGGASHFSMA
jgi:hypothetical protein